MSEGAVTLSVEWEGSAQPQSGGDAYQMPHSCVELNSGHLDVICSRLVQAE